jgi:hypothetical protein
VVGALVRVFTGRRWVLGLRVGGWGFGWSFYWVEVGFKPLCRRLGLGSEYLLGGGGF